jgi:Peptidase family M23.
VLAFPAYASAYGWPVKPFHRQHAIRGAFDDPRISTKHIDKPGIGNEAFHTGVDIAVPDGTRVYAVAGGEVDTHFNRVGITTRTYGRKGRLSFGYWHIRPVVRNREIVHTQQLLGYVLNGYGHVHFCERLRGRYVNPLRRGGLTPYDDHDPPTVAAAYVYQDQKYRDLEQATLADTVSLVASVFDKPPIRTPWPLVVLTPSLVRWELVDESGRTVVPPRTIVDFKRLYSASLLSVYAPGTVQNGDHFGGVYKFWLDQSFDTTKLLNGAYSLIVSASDIRGNISIRVFKFEILNLGLIVRPTRNPS